MPKTRKKYPHIVSTALSPEANQALMDECFRRKATPAAIVREIILRHYDIHPREKVVVELSQSEIEQLKELGCNILSQE